MAEENNAAGNWASAMQQAQTDLLRQWTEMSQAWAANAGSGAGPASGMGPSVGMGPGLSPGMPPGMDALARQFLQQSEQYMGVSRSLMDLLTRSAGAADGSQRARVFTEGLAGLQQQFTSLWSTPPFGVSPGAGFQEAMGLPGAMGGPSLGPTRAQQEAMQRLMELGARCTKAQVQVGAQWNDIIGKALGELGERLTPQLKSGAVPGSIKEVYDLWIDAAEDVYGRAARGAAFVQAQAELANSVSQLRIAQREAFEEWAKQFDLPTRAELNSIHQQLRDLKAALAAVRG